MTVRIAGDSCYGHIVGRASDDCNVECEEKLCKEECPGQLETGMSDFLILDSMRALCVEWFWKKLVSRTPSAWYGQYSSISYFSFNSNHTCVGSLGCLYLKCKQIA